MSADSGIISFLEQVPKLIPSHEVENNLRITKLGVFVGEGFVEKIVQVYQKWIQEVSQSERSGEKCWRRLFGENELKLYYLLDGNKCIPGFLLQGEVAEPQKLKIKFYQGNLLDPVKCVHPKDPYFFQMEKVIARMTTHQGLIFEISAKNRKFEADEKFLIEFSNVIKSSKWFNRDFPEVSRALRYSLAPLTKFLERIQEVPLNEQMLVPDAFIDKRNVKYFRSKGVVFVIEGNKLLSCYSIKGRGLSRFIDREVLTFSPRAEMRHIGRFDPERPKKACLGKVWAKGMSMHIHRRAFDMFLYQISRSRNLRDKLNNRFSVAQVIDRFVGIFINARFMDEREILPYISRHRVQMAKYRMVGRWIFIIVDKNILYNCLAVREVKRPIPDKRADQPKDRDKLSAKS